MTDRELRRLSRLELLELLFRQSGEIERLQKELDRAKESLQDRSIKIEKSGDLAQASMQLSSVFDSAEEAAALYRENTRKQCEAMEADARQKASEIIEEAERLMNAAAEYSASAISKTNEFVNDINSRLTQLGIREPRLMQIMTEVSGLSGEESE